MCSTERSLGSLVPSTYVSSQGGEPKAFFPCFKPTLEYIEKSFFQSTCPSDLGEVAACLFHAGGSFPKKGSVQTQTGPSGLGEIP